ncbi:MAG: flagellin [Eubacterium sp.]|nr:flagellin [Eubacterium sp.]
MVVQHNLTAMNSNRMLGITSSNLSKSAEKLSSGYKVNRAADDAAGLSISEKMRKQIRGLDQASSNAEDGISAVQTAEGALTEVHDMLQRMNELAVKASNGTMSEDDRQTIQDEVDQLLTEIDRVAETTKFNETYLLKGDSSKTTTVTLNAHDAGIKGSWSDTVGASSASVEKVTFTVKTFDVGSVVSIGGTDWTIVDANKSDKDAYKLSVDQALTLIGQELSAANSIGATKAASIKHDTGSFAFEITKATAETSKDLSFSLHVGADADMTNKIGVQISSMDTKGLGIQNLKVVGTIANKNIDTTKSSASFQNGSLATYAIDAIDDAISKVSAQRSKLGAIQNRLEHTVNNLNNVVENTTSAESQIRDTDMASEMVKYSSQNILASAGQSMLAQANQATQGVLSILG